MDEIVKALNIEAIRNLIWNFINNYLKDFDINKYSLTVNAIFKDKFDIYKKDQKSMRHYISNIAGEITTLLGEDFQVNIQAPIYAMISTVEIAKLFLQDIFIGIMFFLWILCVLLVYSLMLGNVNERTYEFGMMRSLGFKKNNLILLIVLQGFIFALPGTLLGLITSYIANNFVAYLFNWYTGLVMPFILSKYNIIFGIAIGISVPLISSYFPIKKSLEDNLRETLDIFNKKIGDKIRIFRSFSYYFTCCNNINIYRLSYLLFSTDEFPFIGFSIVFIYHDSNINHDAFRFDNTYAIISTLFTKFNFENNNIYILCR